MQYAGAYLYQNSPIRGAFVYGSGVATRPSVVPNEAIGIGGWNVDAGWGAGLIVAKEKGHTLLAAGGVEWTYYQDTGSTFTPIGIGDITVPLPYGFNTGMGAFVSGHEWGLFSVAGWDNGSFGVFAGVGADIDYGRTPNFFNPNYWAGTMPVKR